MRPRRIAAAWGRIVFDAPLFEVRLKVGGDPFTDAFESAQRAGISLDVLTVFPAVQRVMVINAP